MNQHVWDPRTLTPFLGVGRCTAICTLRFDEGRRQAEMVQSGSATNVIESMITFIYRALSRMETLSFRAEGMISVRSAGKAASTKRRSEERSLEEEGNW